LAPTFRWSSTLPSVATPIASRRRRPSAAKAGEELKKSLDADLDGHQRPRAGPAGRDRRRRPAVEATRELRERVKDGKPSSAEADRVAAGTQKLKGFIGGRTLHATAGVWARTSGPRQTVAQAYGMTDK
jgi:hypothetical protein